MRRIVTAAALAGSLLMSACNSTEEPDDPATDPEVLATGSVDASSDTSATTQGAGDTTSAAGAGAETGAMDGGTQTEDGQPQEGAGGPSDALSGGDEPAD